MPRVWNEEEENKIQKEPFLLLQFYNFGLFIRSTSQVLNIFSVKIQPNLVGYNCLHILPLS